MIGSVLSTKPPYSDSKSLEHTLLRIKKATLMATYLSKSIVNAIVIGNMDAKLITTDK